jgi:hypothetical protein
MTTMVSHIWKPSPSRIIAIDGFVPVPRGSSASTPPPLSWAPKDPGDVLDYQLNLQPALIGNEGDTIESVDVGVDPSQAGDLSVDSVSADGYRIIFWVSGGQANVTYTVTVRSNMASGRVIQRSVLLPVVPLSVPTTLPNSIQTETQISLNDQNGDPLVTS